MQEEELVRRARLGDKQALEALLYNNYRIVYGYLLKLTMNEDLTKDLTQDVMVKAITRINTFSGKGKFSTWLVSIASNAYKDNLRRNKKLSNVEFETMEVQSSCNVEETVLQKDEISKIKKVLLDIPAKKREVFILKHYYNFSYEDIAKILNCPIGTVKSRLYYCVRKLRQFLELL